MSEEEKERRRQEAKEAEQRGDDAGAYWKDVPEIPTVGHFTSMVGALVATYAIGFLTGKFRPPHRYVEFNILAPQFDYVGFDAPPPRRLLLPKTHWTRRPGRPRIVDFCAVTLAQSQTDLSREPISDTGSNSNRSRRLAMKFAP